MASSTISHHRRFLLFLLLISSCQFTVQKKMISLSFPLTLAPASPASPASSSLTTLSSSSSSIANETEPVNYSYKSSFQYSMALIISLPIGTPPQAQQMVLDTGSQLSWIKCHKKTPPPPTSFDPSLSSTFSNLPCNNPLCKPRIPDYTLPTNCDDNRLCHYSYFYADGTMADGNLVSEKVILSRSVTTPPLILGCAAGSGGAEGILGMNLGRLSFVSQLKLPRFSYCIPIRRQGINPTGLFYLGLNPYSRTFRYVNLLSFPKMQKIPNFDALAYTVGMLGIKIGGKKLDISAAIFRPNAGGSGQTMIDSGTQYTFLVAAAYAKVKEEVARLTGARMKKGYVYGGCIDMCFDGNPTEIGRLIGDMTFEFESGVEITTAKDRILDGVGGGVHCIGIGRSESLGVSSNIIGNFHQQNHWVEFDLTKRRVGFAGVADCSR